MRVGNTLASLKIDRRMGPTTAIAPTSPASVEHDAAAKGFRLVNDQATPGNSKFYGTNGAGVKGWQDQRNVVRAELAIGAFEVTADQIGGAGAGVGGSAGEYTINFATASYPLGLTVKGTSATLNASQELVLTITWLSALSPRRWSVQLYDAQNNAVQNQFALGMVHVQVAAGAVTTITIPGLNAFGATGFIIELR